MNQNKFYFIGSLLILSGTILLGIMHLAISTYIPNLSGWGSSKFAAILSGIMGWFPYILSIVQIVIGTILVWYSLTKNNQNK